MADDTPAVPTPRDRQCARGDAHRQGVGGGGTAWRRTTLTIDGERVDALDCTFEGYFALAHLTRGLSVAVIGPTMLRPDNVELISIGAPTRMEPPAAP
jgi:hypothetical protein